MLQIFVSETDLKDDPLPFYIQAIQSVSAYIFEEDSRLASTQKFILRILERNKKHYENIVLRDTIGRFKDTLDSASSSIPEGF